MARHCSGCLGMFGSRSWTSFRMIRVRIHGITATSGAAPLWHRGTHSAKRVPKMGYLTSWGTTVLLKWPSGGPWAGQSPAPGLPEGHLSTASVPHELRYPFLGTLFCTRNKNGRCALLEATWHMLFLGQSACDRQMTSCSSRVGPDRGSAFIIDRRG